MGTHFHFVKEYLMKSFLKTTAALVLVFFVSTASANAATIAADYLGGGSLNNYDNATGWEFTPNQNVQVSTLGLYDLDAAGFASAHDIGIFKSSDGSAVVTTSLGAGTSGTYIPGTVDGSRVNNVAGVTLQAGTDYYILANNFSTDQYVFGNTAVAFASEITWNQFVEGSTNSIFSNALFNGGSPGNLGPVFTFTTVPEPATATLAMLGLGGLLMRRKRTA